MSWLQGGPFYELSYLFANEINKSQFLNALLNLIRTSSQIDIINPIEEINDHLTKNANGEKDGEIVYRTINLNASINVAGTRKTRIHIQELSTELVKLNFWFYGSKYDADEWNQKGIRDNDKTEFKKLFLELNALLNPVLGTIAYEEDCSGLFDTENCSPHLDYTLSNLKIDAIKERAKSYSYEYCLVNKGRIGNTTKIELINGIEQVI